MSLGKMIKETLLSLFKKPATLNYPHDKVKMPERFRGKLIFFPEKCSGCKLCMKDCPANAIQIIKTGEKEFTAKLDLGECIYCGQCVDSCPRKALEITNEFELAQLDRKKLLVDLNEVHKERS